MPALSAAMLEPVLRAYQAADSEIQQLLAQALHALTSEDDATEAQLLAVVRSFAEADDAESAIEPSSN